MLFYPTFVLNYFMKIAIYSSHNFEKDYLVNANQNKHDLKFINSKLTETNIDLAKGCEAVSLFVSDDASATVLNKLAKIGIKYIALRSVGFNHVDLKVATDLKLLVARVPAYSPNSVAEHAIALIMGLNRKLIKANTRIHQNNFSLDNLVGFDLVGKTVGIIGTGKIGSIAARILHGFGCEVLAYDKIENQDLIQKYNIVYTTLNDLYKRSDIISLHLPLYPETKYLINKASIDQMKKGVMLINTSRGALVETSEVIKGLKTKHIGYFGMDVYEKEEPLVFEDHSQEILQDEMLASLMILDNVLITGHQAFLTQEALKNIAETTIYNIDCFEKRVNCINII